MSNLTNAMKEVYLETLRHSIVDLSFEKKDGTIREMKATLVMDRIPEDKRPKGVRPAQPESSIMRVFDLDLNEFRSVDAAKVLTFGPPPELQE